MKMKDIPVNAKVECADGPCGKSIAVIVDRETKKVTHFALEDKSLPHEPYQRLVPVDQITETAPGFIRLRCTRDDVDRMESFMHTRYVRNSHSQKGYSHYEAGEGPGGVEQWGSPSTVGEMTTKVEEEYVPEGELAGHPGTRVEASDGHIGVVEELVVDPGKKQVTHFVLQKGHLWGKQEIRVPVSAIERVEGDTVYLKLDKKAVGDITSH